MTKSKKHSCPNNAISIKRINIECIAKSIGLTPDKNPNGTHPLTCITFKTNKMYNHNHMWHIMESVGICRPPPFPFDRNDPLFSVFISWKSVKLDACILSSSVMTTNSNACVPCWGLVAVSHLYFLHQSQWLYLLHVSKQCLMACTWHQCKGSTIEKR